MLSGGCKRGADSLDPGVPLVDFDELELELEGTLVGIFEQVLWLGECKTCVPLRILFHLHHYHHENYLLIHCFDLPAQ